MHCSTTTVVWATIAIWIVGFIIVLQKEHRYSTQAGKALKISMLWRSVDRQVVCQPVSMDRRQS